MSRRALALLALILAPAPAALAQAPAGPPAHWTHRKAITLPALGAPAFVEAILDAEVYREAAPSLADLRVRDGEGVEVAYVLRRRETPATRTERAVPLLDLQETAAREVRFTLDVGLWGASPPVHNRVWIRLRADARNFRVPVKVETGDDGRTWNLVRAAGFIYAVEGETRAADTSVAYPLATTRYVRVTVAPAEGRPLAVIGAAVIAETAGQRDAEPVPAAVIERGEDREAKATRLVLDLAGKRPVERAELDIADPRFYRVALVEASDDAKTWRWVGSGALSAIDTPRLRDRQTSFRFPETTARYLRLTIQNLDDRPLRISAVRLHAVRRGVVFQAGPGQRYHLEYGNRRAPAPRYDLVRAFPYLASETVPVAGLGPGAPLPPPRPAARAWTEGRPILLWAAMATVALLLGGMLFRVARQIKGAPLSPTGGEGPGDAGR